MLRIESKPDSTFRSVVIVVSEKTPIADIRRIDDHSVRATFDIGTNTMKLEVSCEIFISASVLFRTMKLTRAP